MSFTSPVSFMLIQYAVYLTVACKSVCFVLLFWSCVHKYRILLVLLIIVKLQITAKFDQWKRSITFYQSKRPSAGEQLLHQNVCVLWRDITVCSGIYKSNFHEYDYDHWGPIGCTKTNTIENLQCHMSTKYFFLNFKWLCGCTIDEHN